MIKTAALSSALLNKNFELAESVFISSEPRSGSTWLMELMMASLECVINWEPLHKSLGVVPRDWKWGERPYIPENSTDPRYLELIKDSLTLQKHNNWTTKYTQLEDVFTANRVLTKCVRSNMLLPWLTANIRFCHSPVLLLRHPIAVSLSQLEVFEQRVTENYIAPDCINNERFLEHSVFLNSLKDPLERKIALWCINNINTITHPHHDKKWIVVYYEHLLSNPQEVLTDIFERINLKHCLQSINSLDFRNPSSTDFNGSYSRDYLFQLQKWSFKLDKSVLNRIQDIFNYFDFKIYGAFDMMPTKLG